MSFWTVLEKKKAKNVLCWNQVKAWFKFIPTYFHPLYATRLQIPHYHLRKYKLNSTFSTNYTFHLKTLIQSRTTQGEVSMLKRICYRFPRPHGHQPVSFYKPESYSEVDFLLDLRNFSSTAFENRIERWLLILSTNYWICSKKRIEHWVAKSF